MERPCNLPQILRRLSVLPRLKLPVGIQQEWSNQVERFAALTEKQIRRGTHRSVRQLEDAIRLYVATYNEEPKPFVWVKAADEILVSIRGFA